MILIFDKLEDFSYKINSQQEIIRGLRDDLSKKMPMIDNIENSDTNSKK